ncbi:MAG: outer membrane protein assembly factor BamE [Deltaproteobacteria bacterium]|nr:outer membrane protein assembly factor BamE [Deltaproteobacteria bacterium]
MKYFLLLGVMGIMSCASQPSKRDFERDQVKDIVIGKTTQRQVYDVFGEPIYYGSRGDDESWWMYVHTVSRNSESLSLYFDKEGRVKDVLYSPFRKSLSEKMQAKR